MLRVLNKWIDEIPPLKQPSRFGNKAYRIWNNRLCQVVELRVIPVRKDLPSWNK